ncbi:hypothetical protein ABEB36_009639 [Hypothenemus hampei]|uniref:Uncharacterized protein n=1 Tax=Hypothenemus hampei TaxID=57062 RepID=A0ABD1EJY1_HYPHA
MPLYKMSNTEKMAGLSRIGEREIPENSLYSEKSKLLLKDALVYYEHLLLENNLISLQSSLSISHEAMLVGQQLFENTLAVLSENKFIIVDELVDEDDICEKSDFGFFESNELSDEYEPEGKKSKLIEHIPLNYKIKVVNIAKAHPTWKLETLQKNGCRKLTKKEYLTQWEKDIINGGNIYDKYSAIDSWTYDRFVEARQDCQQESSIEESLAASRTFCLQTSHLIPNFEEKYVINTDQTGCQYQSTYNRTLAYKGSKAVFVKKKRFK